MICFGKVLEILSDTGKMICFGKVSEILSDTGETYIIGPCQQYNTFVQPQRIRDAINTVDSVSSFFKFNF